MIVSNEYHLPRVKAFIETNPELKEFYNTANLVSSEKVLIDSDPVRWESYIKEAYNSELIKDRVALELVGEKQIRDGTYKFRTK